MLISCGENRDNISDSDLKRISIDFANAKMNLPKSFQQTSFSEYRQKLINSNKPNDVIESSLVKLEQMQSIPQKIILFTDTSNFDNAIWFQEGEHVNLTKSLAQQYMRLLDENLVKQWTPQGIKFSKIDSKYFNGKNAKVIKLKYKLTDNISTRFSTQYIISTNSNTWSITVSNITDQDFEQLVKKIKIG